MVDMNKISLPFTQSLWGAFRCLGCALMLISPGAFSGTWSTEYSISSLDTVHIYVPSTSPVENGKRALMISLHGCASSSTEMKNSGGWKSIADEMGMVVALPDVPGGGIFTDCWDYYGVSHTRYNKYNNDLIALVNELKSRASLNIDSDQVYITGFSSGATQASVVGCLAPDIFAGVGSHSGPGFGTSSNQFGSVPPSYSELDMADRCESFAGSNSGDLDSQIYSTAHGSSDYNVSPGYNSTGAEIMTLVYGASNQGSSQSIGSGGTEVIFSDAEGPRVSRVTVSGLGHAWASSGGGFGYFSNTKIDYPDYVTRWFFENNRRGSGGVKVDDDRDGVYSDTDCDDSNNTIFPGATEVCGDGIDQNCSGYDLSCDAADNDGDGFDEFNDCDDSDNSIFPGATETCGDGIDQSCSGADEQCSTSGYDWGYDWSGTGGYYDWGASTGYYDWTVWLP